MKRSASIRLGLLGGLSSGAIVTAAAAEGRITPQSYYTNDYFIGGAGYYHAPYHSFFARPYNDFDPGRKMYFHGGQWAAAPHRSIINISAPTPEAARLAEDRRTDRRSNSAVSRGGFGAFAGSHYSGS